MAQKMLDDKVRVVEEPEPTTTTPTGPAISSAFPKARNYPPKRRPAAREPLRELPVEEEEEEDIDGESLGSQDTDSEEEEDTGTEGEEEISPPIPTPPQRKRSRQKSSYGGEVTASRQRKRKTPAETEPPAPETQELPTSTEELEDPRPSAGGKSKRQNRGRYRSWAKYRVAIHKALVNAVFDRRKAAEMLKRRLRLFVPCSVLGYYARKLSPSLSRLCEQASEDSDLA